MIERYYTHSSFMDCVVQFLEVGSFNSAEIIHLFSFSDQNLSGICSVRQSIPFEQNHKTYHIFDETFNQTCSNKHYPDDE